MRRVQESPDIAVAFQNQVIPRRHVLELRAVGIVGARVIPDRPHGGIFRTEPPDRRALHADAFRGAQLVVSGHAVQHPYAVNKITLVGIGEVGVERIRIELHLSFGFRRGDDGFLEAFDLGLFVRFQSRFARPVVGVVGDSHHQFCGWHQLRDRLNVFYKPILRGDGAGRRGAPVLVVIHQDYGVGGFSDAGIVVNPVRGRERHHEFQVRAVQVRRQLGNELAEILLAFIGDFLKIDNQPHEVVLCKILDRLLRQVSTRRGTLEHGGHFVGEPVGPVGIVEQRHGGNFDRRILLL